MSRDEALQEGITLLTQTLYAKLDTFPVSAFFERKTQPDVLFKLILSVFIRSILTL